MNLHLPAIALASIAMLQGIQCHTHIVPTFTPEELQQGTQDVRLQEILTTTGLLAIRVPAQENESGQDLLEGLCRCSNNIGPRIHGGDKVLLADGLTTRSTIATATMGTDRPLPLPEDDITLQCGGNTHQLLERSRDYVSLATTEAFMPAVDRLIRHASSESQFESDFILTKKTGQRYTSIQSIVKDAVNLEHFHTYSKGTRDEDDELDKKVSLAAVDKALDWHTDGGLFLAFLPAYTCDLNSNDTDKSFRIKDPESNRELEVSFPQRQEGEVVVAVMLGTGAEHWLQTPKMLKLRATRHAVKMSEGDERAWYGMMHLVPTDALIYTSPRPITFEEFKGTSVHSAGRRFGDNKSSSSDEVVLGCGNQGGLEVNEFLSSSSITSNSSAPSRRRLAHVGGPDDCDGSSSFYCWLSCLEVPDDDKSIDEHLNEGESLYCLDPSVLAATKDVKKAVEECSDSVSGAAGGVMHEACGNYWFETTEGVQTYTVSYDSDLLGTKYCYGKTGMYMQGFEWESSICVVYLFSPWVVTTKAALIGACIGTIVFGILVEFVIRQRRTILSKLEGGQKKMAWSAILYGGQLSTSYLLMLIVMTYSAPLFICVVVGLVIGHVIWNWNDIVKKDGLGEIPLEGSTPCCQNIVEKVNCPDVNNVTEEETTEDDWQC